MAFSGGAFLPYARDGSLRVLLTVPPERSPLLPEVPTWQECGIPPLGVTTWAGLVGPAHMPRSAVERLSTALSTTLAQPQVQARLAELAVPIRNRGPGELASFMKEQLALWREAARVAGLKAE
jgi:tripartite-type tricarboxylate transporter receptor subunit TctC